MGTQRIRYELITAVFIYLNHIYVGAQHCCAPTAWSIYLKIAVNVVLSTQQIDRKYVFPNPHIIRHRYFLLRESAVAMAKKARNDILILVNLESKFVHRATLLADNLAIDPSFHEKDFRVI